MPTARSAAKAASASLTLPSLQEYLAAGGAAVSSDIKDGVPYLSGNLWTAREQQHSIHEISYRACFKPQLPACLLPLLTEPGDRVLDPFMGRGTALIEAALQRRRPAGSDINPLALALTEPRLSTPAAADVEERLRALPLADAPAAEKDDPLLTFYHPRVLGGLQILRKYLLQREADGALDRTDKWIRMVATNRLSGNAAGFFSVRTVPSHQGVLLQAQQEYNARHKQTPPPRNIHDIIMKKTGSLLRGGPVRCADYRLSCTEALSLPAIQDGEISAIITSPPFLDMGNYRRDNWLRCWFNGIDEKTVNLSGFKTVAEWTKFAHECLREFARVLKKGGYVALEFGEMRGGQVRLDEAALAAAADLPFAPVAVLINKPPIAKNANAWGAAAGAAAAQNGITGTGHIALLQLQG